MRACGSGCDALGAAVRGRARTCWVLGVCLQDPKTCSEGLHCVVWVLEQPLRAGTRMSAEVCCLLLRMGLQGEALVHVLCGLACVCCVAAASASGGRLCEWLPGRNGCQRIKVRVVQLMCFPLHMHAV